VNPAGARNKGSAGAVDRAGHSLDRGGDDVGVEPDTPDRTVVDLALHVRGGLRVTTGGERVLGVVQHSHLDAQRLQGLHVRVDRAVADPDELPSRVAVPVYKEGMQVGKATTSTWSPTLKKMIALATVKREYTRPGSRLQFEITVEAVRHHVRATVVKTPFFNPKRKTATPIL